jgi:hypothetical protein
MKKRIISLIIAICCVLSIVVVPTESAKAAPSNLPNGYTLIGSSENLNLYYHSGWILAIWPLNTLFTKSLCTVLI